MQPEDGASDDAERAQRSRGQFRQVVSSDVFYHFAPAACERAIGKSNGDTDDEVAECAEAKAQCAAVVGGENATDGRLFRPQRIKRQTLAVLRKRFLQSLNGAAGFDSYSATRATELHDAVEILQRDKILGGVGDLIK